MVKLFVKRVSYTSKNGTLSLSNNTFRRTLVVVAIQVVSAPAVSLLVVSFLVLLVSSEARSLSDEY